MTFPAPGAVNVTNQPDFTWQGAANLGGPYVQVNDGNAFYQDAYLSAGQTDWLCPVTLNSGGYYNFNFDYSSNADSTIVATTPLNNLSQPFPGWVSTCTMYTYNDAWFTVSSALAVVPPPLLEYPMNETNWSGTAPQVNDSTGNGHNGAAAGGANTVSDLHFVKVGGFNGSGQYVTVAGPSYSMSGARTIVAWVNPAANSDSLGQPIVVGGSSGAADLFGISGTGGENSGIPQYELFVDDWNSAAYYSTSSITAGQWNFVAMTYDGSGTIHFYINGADAGFGSQGSGPFTLYTYDIDSYVVGGTGANTGGQTTMNGSLNGLMADVGIYATELSADQIAALYLATYPTNNAPPAGLTLHFDMDHNGPGENSAAYYLLFPELSVNAAFAGLPGTAYFVSSYTSACTAQMNPDGSSSYNGGVFSDFNSLLAEFTNTWTLTVTNLASTNLYTFQGSAFSSNALPLVAISYPTDGSTNIARQPVFAWSGATNLGNPYVQLTDTNGFLEQAYLPTTQTSWQSPAVLNGGGTYNFLMDYAMDEDATVFASTPLDSLSHPVPGWVSTSTLSSYNGATFTVNSGLPVLPITLSRGTALTNGVFEFHFTNAPSASFTALVTTNLNVPFTNWSVLGSARELSSGHYQFTDPQAGGSPHRFYRVSSP